MNHRGAAVLGRSNDRASRRNQWSNADENDLPCCARGRARSGAGLWEERMRRRFSPAEWRRSARPKRNVSAGKSPNAIARSPPDSITGE
jgi:hypothetical protein